jgi:hypothetical protein
MPPGNEISPACFLRSAFLSVKVRVGRSGQRVIGTSTAAATLPWAWSSAAALSSRSTEGRSKVEKSTALIMPERISWGWNWTFANSSGNPRLPEPGIIFETSRRSC